MKQLDADMNNAHTKQAARDGQMHSARPSEAQTVGEGFRETDHAYELGMWLRTLRSFFHIHNHPFSETDQAELLKRDWTNELRIARRTLLRGLQLSLHLVSPERALDALPAGESDALTPNAFLFANAPVESDAGATDRSLIALIEALGDACAMCESLLEARDVSFQAWTSAGGILARALDHSDAARALMRAAAQRAAADLQAPLFALTREGIRPAALGADMLIIFTDLARLLEWLHFVETLLQRDRPLKQALPIFALVQKEARDLIGFIETRAMRTEGLDEALFDALDGTNYAISIELRKVFARELVGLSALRQAPPIYIKVENAHGLLRDCFQQSAVALTQCFDPSVEGGQLFPIFRTKLEQSVALRRDLWGLVRFVRRLSRDGVGAGQAAAVLARLKAFEEGSLRLLMYKDREPFERFVEEAETARDPAELSAVLHRLEPFLETLFGQVNMRAVLADHPFEPEGEE